MSQQNGNKPKTAKEKKDAQIQAGVESLKLDDTPKAKSKNLDVLKEFENAKRKNAANFVVIGKVVVEVLPRARSLISCRSC